MSRICSDILDSLSKVYITVAKYSLKAGVHLRAEIDINFIEFSKTVSTWENYTTLESRWDQISAKNLRSVSTTLN